MLLDLPLDVLVAIIEEVADQIDLKHLCEVSRSLQDLTTPILYKSITVRAEEERSLQSIDVLPLLRTRYSSRNLLHFVKAIRIRSQFRFWTRDRCVHNTYDASLREDSSIDEDDEGHSAMSKLTENLLPLLEGLSDDKLQEFAWELGCCIPKKILGGSSYLTDKQSSIESIRLITDGACAWNTDGQCPVNLSAFKRLKKLSWKGVRSESDFDALTVALNQNAHHLREFELDLIRWHRVKSTLVFGDDDDEGSENFFAQEILRIPPDGSRHMFPALQVLSLSAVSFEPAVDIIASAFDFSSLRSLKLRFCPGWSDLLNQITQSNQTINLKSLEIQSDYEDCLDEASVVLASFLQTFVGLEEFFVYTASPEQTLDLWRSLIHHSSTLKRFVHHQRSIDIDPESHTFEEACDLPDLSLVPKDIAELVEDTSNHPFNDLNLECIGLCCFPTRLNPILLPLTRRRTLQVLHIRQSGTDTDYFASWGVRRFGDASQSDSEFEDDSLVMGLVTEGVADTPPSDSESEDSSSGSELVRTGRSDKIDRINDSSSDVNELSAISTALHGFAQWAFGPNGFPSLRVLVFGDFSYESRFPENNVYLCRNQVPDQIGEQTTKSQSFQLLAEDDRALWDLLDKYSNVLEACPTDFLFED